MKSIMLSTNPEWVAKIMNGEKEDEIRKTKPNCELPIDVFIYVTRGEPYLYKSYEDNGGLAENGTLREWVEYGISNSLINECNCHKLNGKVVAKFTLNTVEEIFYDHDEREEWYATKTLNDKELEKSSCLSYEDLDDYLKGSGYAWHISNLVIFDKPKELSEFGLKRAPQSWQYVEVEE